MGSKFFTGFTFDLKRIAIGCTVMAFPFLVLLYKEIPHYKYYFYGQPKYEELIVVNGIIADDVRNPPKPYNKRADGIYIDTGNEKINIYCDNPSKPLISYSTRGGGAYGLGQCEWIALKRSRNGLCDNKLSDKLCKNPRYFYGDKISAKIDYNNTIYELYLNDRLFYKYDEMVLNYKNEFISNIRVYSIIVVVLILVSLFCMVSIFNKKG